MTVRGSRINPRYTFGSFVVGKSNELAHAASLAVSENPGESYNPLFIYSAVGLGKTHLLNAIGLRLSSRELSLEYATTEEFTNGYIKAIREGKTDDFRDRYRSADVLLLDDIQFIIGKEQTQEGFFHTFNSLHAASRQIVITSDRPATQLTLLEDRIRSRLTGGLAVDIQRPDLETRQAILSSKAEAIGLSFPIEVLEFLAEKIDSNVRDLEGCLNRISAYAQLTSSKASLEIAERCVQDILHSPNGRKRVSEIAVLETVCGYFAIDKASIRGRGRDKPTALARQVAMYLLREEAKLPLSAIGRFLGGKDHTTVLYAHQRISDQMTLNSHLRKDVSNLREELARL
jgi:chromosomal replication initiator protein